jgi:hypothetical protein
MEPSIKATAPLTTTSLSSSAPLVGLSDTELLIATRRLVGRSNQLLASLLAHLAEVEARGIHRTRACASLYTYCIYELRFSEDEAFRRVSAARLVRRFPALFAAISAGELHLTGLLMLGPHLTPDNLVEVLALAKHRTKKELARLVRRLDPLPEVPSRIEPLGPAPSHLFSSAPTWSQSVRALNPIRELEPGARPRDWVDSTQSAPSANDGSRGARLDYAASADQHALARWDDGRPAGGHALATLARCDCATSADQHALARCDADQHALARCETDEHALAAPARCDADQHAPARRDAGARPAELTLGRLEPQRYRVQFEASEEYVELVERAKALLSHGAPRPDLGDLHLRAMRALVAELEREKYAVTKRHRVARRSPPELADEQLRREEPSQNLNPNLNLNPSPEPKPEPEPEPKPKPKPKPKPEPEPEPEPKPKPEPEPPRRRGRHIPAPVRRAVFERDAGRCTYRSDSGERCRETGRLELHHSTAFAQGGEHRLDNVSLRCRAHNALAAEHDFGRDFVARACDSSQHELWARHERPCALPPSESEGEGQRLRAPWHVDAETGLGMQQIT